VQKHQDTRELLAARKLIQSLETNAAPRDRGEEERKARERSQKRFA